MKTLNQFVTDSKIITLEKKQLKKIVGGNLPKDPNDTRNAMIQNLR